MSVSPPLDPPFAAPGTSRAPRLGPGASGVDAEQQRAIERRAGDLLLDAGAGSGKTSVLVERFVQSVLQDGIDVAAMLTITFTEKAAAELRDRIRLRLRALGAPEAARRTESAFISTIHGFCARVLRANALAAGLDPQFAVLDRYQSEPLAVAAFEAALEELARGAGGAGAVDLIADYTQWSLRAAVLAVYAQLRSAGQLHPRLPEVAPDEGTDTAHPAAELTTAARALAGELGAISDPSPRVREAIDRVAACLELAAGEEVWPPDLDRGRLPRNGAALSTDACVRYTEALGRFRVHCATVAARPVRDLLDQLLDAYGRHYEQRKRAVSGLDFEDLELVTRRLLLENSELRQRYATRFERIMVDELQDTNRVQLELVESIARDNLFTVGDAQQSIYGFRHAEVELFERRGERLEAVGARETLQTNFRSRPEILDAVNLAFAEALGERFRGCCPAGRDGRRRLGRSGPAAAGPAGPDGPAGQDGLDDPAVEFVLVDKAADWENEGVASPWRVAEARTLANRVGELVAAGHAPGEIVVLMRATTDMRAYERALERRGLPTYVIGGRGYWSHPQVVDLVAYLRALANPRDEESLYGVLASPLVGVSLDALVVLAAASRATERDPWWLLREPRGELAGLDEADRARLATFTGWFAGERARARRCGMEELIDSALVVSGYDLTMLAMPGGRRRLANVRKLMRLAREHEDAHGPDLHGFLDLVSDREGGRSPESRESEAPMEGEGLDAIRLMTIHRAKGLEFPVVVVADLGRAVRPPSEIVRVTPDGRLGLRLSRAGAAGRENALDYRAIGDEQRAAQEAEERRLFYVAVTRAKERLVLSGALKFDGFIGEGGATGGGPAAWLAPAFIPDLGEVMERGGGEVAREGTRIAVRIGRPEDLIRDPGVGRGARASGGSGAARGRGVGPGARRRRRPRRARRRRRRPRQAPRSARSATPRWASTPAAATASTPSASSGCRRSPSPAAPPSRPRVPGAPPTAACSCTRCSRAWTSAARRSPAPTWSQPRRHRRACIRRRAPPRPTSWRRWCGGLPTASCAPGWAARRRPGARSASPSRSPPIRPSRWWSAPSTCSLVSPRGGCSSSTTRATGWRTRTRPRSSRANTRPSGSSTPWRRCTPVPRRWRSRTASSSSPTAPCRSPSSAPRWPT